jgi:aspartate 1-decarboxylase
VIVIAYASMTRDEAKVFVPNVVHVDAHNKITHLGTDPSEPLHA